MLHKHLTAQRAVLVMDREVAEGRRIEANREIPFVRSWRRGT